MEVGETLITFVFQNCPKVFLPKESALVRLSQVVASILNITDCWVCCPPPDGSGHDLPTSSLNVTKKVYWK